MLWVVYRVVIVIRVARNEYVYPQHRGAQPLNFFFFCTTLIYIKRYKIAITIITVVHRYHWRYHSTLATTLLHDLHDLWHRGYQDSTTIHAFTRTHVHTRTHIYTRISKSSKFNIISRSFFFFFKLTRNTACCLQLLNLGFLASQSHRLEINNVHLFPLVTILFLFINSFSLFLFSRSSKQ